MTRQQKLLVRAMEECNELAQRISKALIFGLEEVQPEQPLANSERINYEFNDLVAVLRMIHPRIADVKPSLIAAKRVKVEKYMRYATEVNPT